MAKVIVLQNKCLFPTCKKVAKHAFKTDGDFWMTTCNDHKGKSIILNKDNVSDTGRYIDASKIIWE